MKVWIFTIREIHLNTYLPYILPDCLGQLVVSLPHDKEILYHAMSNMWKKVMAEEGYNYLDDSIHSMEEFFKTT